MEESATLPRKTSFHETTTNGSHMDAILVEGPLFYFTFWVIKYWSRCLFHQTTKTCLGPPQDLLKRLMSLFISTKLIHDIESN